MKKSLLALAVLGAFAGAAQAQTGVTVYGSFDAGVRHQTNVSVAEVKNAAGVVTTAKDNASSNSNTTMGSSGTYNSNRFGFKGVEDLGGGLNAHFTLEGGFNSGTGVGNAGLFDRSAFVGLGGSWGSVDLGRQYSINFQTVGAYDPFNYKYTGIIPLAGLGGLTRFNNDIKYTGTFGPVTARVEYALGEVAGNTSASAHQAVGVNYAGGPFSAGAAYTQGKTAADLDTKHWTVGGAFATGPFRVALGYDDDKQDATATTSAKTKNWWLGGSYNVTPAAALTAAYYETKATSAAGADGKRKLFIVGATYALSKRTNFYADIDNSKLNGTLVGTEDKQTGVSVGINHLF